MMGGAKCKRDAGNDLKGGYGTEGFQRTKIETRAKFRGPETELHEDDGK